jgi:hypothetical protein
MVKIMNLYSHELLDYSIYMLIALDNLEARLGLPKFGARLPWGGGAPKIKTVL